MAKRTVPGDGFGRAHRDAAKGKVEPGGTSAVDLR